MVASLLISALQLPQAQYHEPTDINLPNGGSSFVAARFESAVIHGHSNNSDVQRAVQGVCSTELYTCTGVLLHNRDTQTLAMCHLRAYPDLALRKIINSNGFIGHEIDMHVVGANLPLNGNSYDRAEKVWVKEMCGLLEVVRANPNISLKTFDVGTKPHPITFGATISAGNLILIRGTQNVVCDEDTDFVRTFEYAYSAPFRNAMKPINNDGMRLSVDHPVHITYDDTVVGKPSNRAMKLSHNSSLNSCYR